MRNGDISDAQAPRVIYQWEHLIAARRPQSGMLARFRRPDPFDISLMEPEPHVVKILWDTFGRRGYRVDAWTQWPEAKVPAIRNWCRDLGLPIRAVTACSIDALERRLQIMPFVVAVVHCGDGRPLAFRGRGMYAASPAQTPQL